MIEINNLTPKKVDKKWLEKIANEVLKRERKKGNNFSIVLVNSRKIKELNKKYRKRNQSTDVLAFPEKEKFFKKFSLGKILGLGEIFICLEQVEKNAKKLKLTFKKELSICLIHGILHLLSYGHESSKKKAQIMEKRQNYFLNLFFAQ